jgi:hypothetical protein
VAARRPLTVRERIDPAITASLFSNYRSSADAIMELVDNALDARLPRTPLGIQLTIHGQSITVYAEGGEGMGPRDLEQRYLRWGASTKRGRNLLGQYGQGGKAAIGHLGSRFSVEASRQGDEFAWRFHDADYRDRSRLKTYELEVVPKRAGTAVGYVRIRIDGVDRRVDVRRLGIRLAEVYRPLLATAQLQIVLNGMALSPVEISTLEKVEFRVRAAGTYLVGWIGIADRERVRADLEPGIRCYKLGRLIHEGEFFGHPSAAQLPGLAKLIGEVELPPVPLTMNKSDFDRDSPQWVAVEARLHDLLAPWVRRLMRDDQIPPPRSAVRAAEQARRLLSQALRLAERAELFPGEVSGGARPPAAGEEAPTLPLTFEKTAGTQPESTDRPAPRVPASQGERPPGKRRGFGSIRIAALDPAIRSRLVVEDGTSWIIVNSRYPLFLERGGDVLYQVETAAREICRTVEGLTVAEYEHRIEELLNVVFQLRRPRRGRAVAGRQLKLPKS